MTRSMSKVYAAFVIVRELYKLKTPIQQAKEHILKVLRSANPDVTEIIYPCLEQDLGDYLSALQLVEVQAEFNHRGVVATARAVSKSGKILPDIVVATLDDVASGKLDKLLKREQ